MANKAKLHFHELTQQWIMGATEELSLFILFPYFLAEVDRLERHSTQGSGLRLLITLYISQRITRNLCGLGVALTLV